MDTLDDNLLPQQPRRFSYQACIIWGAIVVYGLLGWVSSFPLAQMALPVGLGGLLAYSLSTLFDPETRNPLGMVFTAVGFLWLIDQLGKLSDTIQAEYIKFQLGFFGAVFLVWSMYYWYMRRAHRLENEVLSDLED